MATAPEPALQKIEGMVINYNGQSVVKVNQHVVSGHLVVVEKRQMSGLTVEFLGKNGAVCSLDPTRFKVCCLNNDPRCATLEFNGNPDISTFNLCGDRLGYTRVRFQLLNAHGPIYTSPYIFVRVRSQNKDIDIKPPEEA